MKSGRNYLSTDFSHEPKITEDFTEPMLSPDVHHPEENCPSP